MMVVYLFEWQNRGVRKHYSNFKVRQHLSSELVTVLSLRNPQHSSKRAHKVASLEARYHDLDLHMWFLYATISHIDKVTG